MPSPISQIAPVAVPELSKSPTVSAGQPGGFQKVLGETIGNLESLNHTAADSIQQYLNGRNEELHTTILATQRATLAFDLGLQVRNKVVDAYQEVMRMQM